MSLLISEDDANERLDRADIVYKRIGHGSNGESRSRGSFKSGIPHFVREIIGAEAKAGNGSHKDIGESWGISDTTVKNIEDGRVGRHQLRGSDTALVTRSESLAEDMEGKIINKTTEKLLATVSAIDEEAVKGDKPITQSAVARNLASIIERLKPRVIAPTNVQFNVFVPPERSEASFGEPIRVKEVASKR